MCDVRLLAVKNIDPEEEPAILQRVYSQERQQQQQHTATLDGKCENLRAVVAGTSDFSLPNAYVRQVLQCTPLHSQLPALRLLLALLVRSYQRRHIRLAQAAVGAELIQKLVDRLLADRVLLHRQELDQRLL